MSEFISSDECLEIARIMENKYSIYLDERGFVAKAEYEADNDAVYVEVVLRNAEESFFYPVSARIKPALEELKPYAAATLLFDVIDSYFEEYFTSGESIYLPIDWTNMEYDAAQFQIKGQIFNRKIEKMADELLASGEVYTGKNIIV